MSSLEELKTAENLKDYVESNLQKSKGGFYCCPVCGSGTHGNGTGALSIDKGNPYLWKCFSCGEGGSVIDLVKAVERKDTTEAIKRVRELYDPEYDAGRVQVKDAGAVQAGKGKQEKGKAAGPVARQATQEPDVPRRDFRNYYKRCRNNIQNTSYPRYRGLDEETVKRFELGFDPEWVSPTAAYKRKVKNRELERAGQPLLPSLAPSPRLIVPLSANNYLARDTRPDAELTESQYKFRKMNEGKDKPFFNLSAMGNPLCFFVTEGEINAMSIEQAGGSCVALGTAARAKAFGELLKKMDPLKAGTVVISLDNDKAGIEAQDILDEACMIVGLNVLHFNVSGQYNDPNDYLVHDRQGFYKAVTSIIENIREEKMKDFADKYTAHGADLFMRRTKSPALRTGFGKLDKFLGGGITSNGLVFIGGLSSIGKTTFVLQVAEFMATNRKSEGTQEVLRGKDILYFALEQSEEDLLSKIFSRRMYIESKKDKELAKSNWQLLQEDRQAWPQKTWDALWGSYTDFRCRTGGNLRIVESPGRLSVVDIVEYTREHIAITGRVPVIVIDYLQILKPVSDKLTDKQAIDETIVLLKQLSRDYKTCVIGISSFNRQNYWQPVNMTAFKESGNLEYSADLLLAIAPAGMKDSTDDDEKEEKVKADNKRIVDDCKEAEVKKIQLHILKNRNGRITGRKNKLLFSYQAKYNCFEEVEPESYLDYFDNGNPLMNGKKKVVI